MFKQTSLAAAVGLALSLTAHAADDYRWELGAGYSDAKLDADAKYNGRSDSEHINSDIWGGYGTFYLKPVDTSKGPLAEAAFLDHASSIKLYADDGQVDLSSLDDRLNDKDGQRYGVSTRYVAEGPGWELSGWLVDLDYLRSEPGDKEIDTYNIGIGKYLTKKTTLVLNYGKVNVNNGGDTDGYSLDLAHLWSFTHGAFKATASAGKVVVKNADDIDSYALGGTYYVNDKLGFGAGYTNTSQDGYEVDSWNVSADWFVTEKVALSLGYTQQNPDDIKFQLGDVKGKVEVQNDIVSVGARVRF